MLVLTWCWPIVQEFVPKWHLEVKQDEQPLFVLIIGIGIWLRSGKVWYWLFIGTLIALIVNAFPLSLVGTLPGSIAEFFMTLTLLLTERYIQHHPATDLPNSPVLDRV